MAHFCFDFDLVAGFLLISFMTFALLILSGPSGAWRYYMAGGVCACASHAIATPIDVVKVRFNIASKECKNSFG